MDTDRPSVTAIAGHPLIWRESLRDGGRHYLDGRPIHCGMGLELLLPGGVWLPVRYETEHRSRFTGDRRPCARCGQGDKPGGRVWAHRECPPPGTEPPPPRETYRVAVLYFGIGHAWEHRFEARHQASIDAGDGPRCTCQPLVGARLSTRRIAPDGTCAICDRLAPDDVLLEAAGIRGTWRVWDRRLGMAVDAKHRTPDPDDPDDDWPTWPEAERDRWDYRGAAVDEAKALQRCMAPCPQASIHPPESALYRWPEARA